MFMKLHNFTTFRICICITITGLENCSRGWPQVGIAVVIEKLEAKHSCQCSWQKGYELHFLLWKRSWAPHVKAKTPVVTAALIRIHLDNWRKLCCIVESSGPKYLGQAQLGGHGRHRGTRISQCFVIPELNLYPTHSVCQCGSILLMKSPFLNLDRAIFYLRLPFVTNSSYIFQHTVLCKLPTKINRLEIETSLHQSSGVQFSNVESGSRIQNQVDGEKEDKGSFVHGCPTVHQFSSFHQTFWNIFCLDYTKIEMWHFLLIGAP